MQPPVKKTDDKTRRDDERAELYKLRDAAWGSHNSCKNTGTCEFLKLLLAIHQQLLVLDAPCPPVAQPLTAVQHAPPLHSHDDSRFKSLEASVANLSDQVRGIGQKLDAPHSTAHTATSEQSGKGKK